MLRFLVMIIIFSRVFLMYFFLTFVHIYYLQYDAQNMHPHPVLDKVIFPSKSHSPWSFLYAIKYFDEDYVLIILIPTRPFSPECDLQN